MILDDSNIISAKLIHDKFLDYYFEMDLYKKINIFY